MTAIMTATTRPAIVAAHEDIGKWITFRRERITTELEEIRVALATARERKWATDPLARQVRRLEKHELFLSKVALAIAAGYAIVPNFNLQALAVRTDKAASGEGPHHSPPMIGAARLPAGQGDFVSPEPELESYELDAPTKDNPNRTVTMFRATEHAPVDVPFVLMKQDLADALHKAMGEKLFDEIGIVRDSPRGDPILVGRIHHPKKMNRWDNRGVTFFIGWWFDPRQLEL